MTDLQIEQVPIGDLTPYGNNPRIMRTDREDSDMDAIEMVARSITEFGFRVPIVVDRNNVIAAGHTRYGAAVKLGLKHVPVIRAGDLDEEQIKRYRIADNKVAEWTGWDIKKLADETLDIESLPGFKDEEFEVLHALALDHELQDEKEADAPAVKNTYIGQLPDRTDEFVQLTFYVRREHAKLAQERIEGILEEFQKNDG